MTSRPQSLVIVLRSFRLGGAERQAALLANYFHETGTARVQIVAFEDGDGVRGLVEPEIPLRILHPGKGSLPYRLYGLTRLGLGLRALKPDILLPFTDWPNKVVNAFWQVTGATSSIWNQRDEGREVTGHFIERRALAKASWFVANSPSGSEFLETQFGVAPTRISLIPNMVAALVESRSRASWRAGLHIDPSSPVFTMLATLSRFKDHDSLLRAWPAVRAEIPSAVLLVAGRTGDAADEIVSRARSLDGVQILGEVGDVGGLLGATDVLVHVSNLEGMPNVVLEGMMARLPIVASDIPGTRLALGDDYRFLVPMNNPSVLGKAMITLARNGQTRTDFGERNRSRAAQIFSPERIGESWRVLLHRLFANGKTVR